MHKNRFRLGLRPRLRWRSLRRSPRPRSAGRGSAPGRLHSRAFGTRLAFAVRGAVSVCVYCVNCTKFGQLILRIIIKIDATRCQIFRLKCTKIVFGWGSSPSPRWRSFSAPPCPLAGLKGLGGGGDMGREGKGRKGRGRQKRGKGREGRAPPNILLNPQFQFSRTMPACYMTLQSSN